MRPRPAEPGPAARLLPVGLACLGLLGPAWAVDEPQVPRSIALEPRASVTETLTDNHDVSSQGGSDAITRLSAGLGWRDRSGAVQGYLDYMLTSLVYARHSDRNEVQNALNANVLADLIDKRLQLAASAAIARTAISAFGAQPGGGADGNANTTETRTLQLTPTLRGPLGPALRYNAALGHAVSSSANSNVGDSSSTSASLRIEPSSPARLGWSLDASHLGSDYKLGRKTRTERLYGGLRLDLDALDLQLTGTAGTERTDIVSLDSRRYSTWGVGASWTPSPRTRVSAEMEERFFGRSHALSIEHRTPRTIFLLRSARSLSTSGSQVAGERGTAYELFFRQFASLQPDENLRRALVERVLTQLNIDPTSTIDTGFLRSAATLQDLLEFSAAWTGPRNTAVLLLSRSTTRRVDTLSTAVDDLSQVDELRTSTLSLNLGHRLTPLSTLNLLLQSQRASSGQANLSSRQTLAELQFSTRLTPDSSVGASLRRAQYNIGLQRYSETALSAQYGVRF